MSTKRSQAIPRIVSQGEWEAARKKIFAKEKAMTRALGALAAERRRLPMVLIGKNVTPLGRQETWEGLAGRVAANSAV